MKLLFFVGLLLALEGCQGSGRFEATQIGPFAISNGNHRGRRLRGLTRRKVMEWFSRKTSIVGVQIPNWGVALGAVIVILLIYNSMH